MDEDLVVIKLISDDQGRFGFNVKGGTDLRMPILVSRVLPQTPADRSVPKICEGDQVVLINGKDVSTMKHEQVVNLIRASREYQGGELTLTIKPNGNGHKIKLIFRTNLSIFLFSLNTSYGRTCKYT